MTRPGPPVYGSHANGNMAAMPSAIKPDRHTECLPFLMEGILTTLLSLVGGLDAGVGMRVGKNWVGPMKLPGISRGCVLITNAELVLQADLQTLLRSKKTKQTKTLFAGVLKQDQNARKFTRTLILKKQCKTCGCFQGEPLFKRQRSHSIVTSLVVCFVTVVSVCLF